MIRLKMIVEGLTEETFVRDILAEHLLPFQVYPYPRRVETGRRRIAGAQEGGRRISRGGMTTYQKAKGDILRWIKQEKDSPDVFVTTMFDLYALPEDFPEFDQAMSKPTPESRVQALEEAFRNDIGFARFVPYIQLHEFEALVLADPRKIAPLFQRAESDRAIRHLMELAESTPPEEINDGEQTAPSKRIIREIPEYAGAKSSVGPLIVQAIGREQVRSKCPHFDRWVSQLEALITAHGPGSGTSR
jgi:hypothetical protein